MISLRSFALAALAIAAAPSPSRAGPLLGGELQVGSALDYGSFGDYDHYLVNEIGAAVDGVLHDRWLFGFRGSFGWDSRRWHNSRFEWQPAHDATGPTFHAVPLVGFKTQRARLRIGPILHGDSRGRSGMVASFLPYGAGDFRLDNQRWYLLIRSYDQVPYASAGSGLHVGFGLPAGYGSATEAAWSLYITLPALVGLSSRHHFASPWPGAEWIVQASAGFDILQGALFTKGPALEAGVSFGVAWQPTDVRAGLTP